MQDIEIRTGVIKPIECVKEALEYLKSDYWLLFAIWLVGGIIGGATFFIAAGAMTCGTFYAYLRKIDGHQVAFDDLWKGMQWFVPGLVVMMLIVVPMILVYVVIYVPVLLATVMGSNLSQDELMSLIVAAIGVELILIFIMVCLHTLLIFSFPLIVDRNIGAVAAITTSSRAVFKNLGGVGGLIAVNFGLVIAGYAALCIGIYFVVPLIIATNVVAYRKVFPGSDERRYDPPPPNFYTGGNT